MPAILKLDTSWRMPQAVHTPTTRQLLLLHYQDLVDGERAVCIPEYETQHQILWVIHKHIVQSEAQDKLLVQVEGRSLHKLGAHFLQDKALHSQHQLVGAQHTQHHQLLHGGQVLLPGLRQGLLSWGSRVKDGLPWGLQQHAITKVQMVINLVYECWFWLSVPHASIV